MKGFIKQDEVPGKGRYVHLDQPTVGDHDVLLKIELAGICGTDTHVYNWAPSMSSKIKLPVIMGHEAAGTVVETGRYVANLQAGDRIAIESHIWCGKCSVCNAGLEHVCPHTEYFGINVDGVFANYTSVPARVCRKVPESISNEEASMLEPLGVAVHASTCSGGIAGARVLIAGCGPIGLMNIAAAKALDAKSVHAVDVNPKRLQSAEELGADRLVNVGKADLLDQLPLTEIGQFDVAIDYTGNENLIGQLAQSLRPGGSLRLLAIPANSSSFPYHDVVLRGIEVIGVHGRKLFETWEIAESLLAEKRVNLKPVVSHRLSLADAATGFDLIANQQALKVLLIPDDAQLR